MNMFFHSVPNPSIWSLMRWFTLCRRMRCLKGMYDQIFSIISNGISIRPKVLDVDDGINSRVNVSSLSVLCASVITTGLQLQVHIQLIPVLGLVLTVWLWRFVVCSFAGDCLYLDGRKGSPRCGCIGLYTPFNSSYFLLPQVLRLCDGIPQ